HVVGLRYLLEPLLGLRVLVDVGMVGARQLAVGALDLLLPTGSGHAEHGVVVAARHHCAPVATTTDAGRSCRSSSPYPGLSTRTTVPAGASGIGTAATAS